MLQQIESQAMLLDVDESSDILAIFRSAWPGDKQKLRGFLWGDDLGSLVQNFAADLYNKRAET